MLFSTYSQFDLVSIINLTHLVHCTLNKDGNRNCNLYCLVFLLLSLEPPRVSSKVVGIVFFFFLGGGSRETQISLLLDSPSLLVLSFKLFVYGGSY